MIALFLYGIYGTSELWNQLIPRLPTWECEILSYPHEMTEKATCITDFTKWVKEQTKDQRL